MIVNALGIPRFDGNVVTDALHFDGALVHLMELQKQGLDLRLVMPRANRIEMRDLERVVDGKTKLIYRISDNVYELYDLGADPTEQKNLAASRPELLEQMKAALTRWMESAL